MTAQAARQKPLRVGLSACYFHADPKRAIFKGKTLIYLEESLAHWAMSEGNTIAYMIPSVAQGSHLQIKDFVADLDGVIFSGGSDLSPETYGEKPLKPEWSGDALRDVYEIEIFKACLDLNKPVLGVCRGMQLINAALGGTLYQDIETQVEGSQTHRDWNVYDQLFHEIEIDPKGHLTKLFPSQKQAKVNSVHHQGIKDLGDGLVCGARSLPDQIIETVHLDSTQHPDRYVHAVQWHPEFQKNTDKDLISPQPILDDFFQAIRERIKTS